MHHRSKLVTRLLPWLVAVLLTLGLGAAPNWLDDPATLPTRSQR